MPAFNELFVSVLDRFIKVVKSGIQSLGRVSPKYTFNTFLIVFLGLILFFIYNWVSNINTVNIVNAAVERVIVQARKDDAIRDSVRKINEGPEHYIHTMEVDNSINEELSKLINSINADRVMLSSFHNHEEGVMLGYSFYDEAYEKVNKDRHIIEVADRYQKIRTSLSPITYYMLKKGYLQGTFKDVLNIDLRYGHRMEEDGAYFGAWYFIWSETGKPIGILSCSWYKGNRKYIPNAETLEKEMKIQGEVIRTIIDQAAKQREQQEDIIK